MAHRLILFLALLASVSSAPIVYGGTFTSPAGMTVTWETTDWEELKISMSYTGTGWLSVGFTNQRKMAESDVYVGWVGSDKKVYLYDGWVDGKTQPSRDNHIGGNSSIYDISGSEVNGVTKISFSRKLNTSDAFDYTIGLGTKAYVMWAFGSTDGTPSDDELIQINRHTRAGQVMRELLVPTAPIDIVSPGKFSALNGTLSVMWTLSQDQKALDFIMVGQTTGYVSVAFNDNKGMSKGDYVVGWVDNETKKVTVIDAYDGPKGVKPDETFQGGKQSVYNVSGSQESGRTTIRFSRLIDTGDMLDRKLSGPGLWLLAAMGTQDAISGHGKNRVSAPMWFVSPSGSYTNDDKSFSLSWTSDTSRFITFTMSSTAKGYMAMGLHNSRCAMAGADMITAWFVDNAVTLLDQYSKGPGQNIDDSSNDLILHSSDSKSMKVVFSRRLITGDVNDTAILESKAVTVLWATSDAVPVGKVLKRHSARDCTSVVFPVLHNEASTDPVVIPVPDPKPDPVPVVKNNTSTPGRFESNKFVMTWSVKGKYINITMSAPTQSYVSVGFNSIGAMDGADYVVGWVDDKGKGILLDQYSATTAMPTDDSRNGGKNDVQLISAVRNKDGVSITFTRLLDTGDKYDRPITNASNFHLLWAYGGSIPPALKRADEPEYMYTKHSLAGFQRGFDFFNLNSTGNKPGPPVSKPPPADPGFILVICVCGIIALWGICRLVYHVIVRLAFSRTNSAAAYHPLDPDGDSGMDSDYDGPYKPKNNVRPKNGYNALHEDRERQEDKQMPPMTWRPMSLGPKIFNIFYGIGLWRIPFTSIRLSHTILFIGYLGLNLACMYIVPVSGPITGKYWGTLIMANSFISVLPASRNSLLTVITGLPFERTVAFHRWVGRLVVFLTLVHALMVLRRQVIMNLDWRAYFFYNPSIANIYGMVSLVAGVLMFFTSLPWVRRLQWETFYWTHFLFFLFFIFSWLHDDKSKWYVVASIIVYGIDRVFRLIWGTLPVRTSVFRVKGSSGGVVQIKFPKNYIAKKMGVYEAGQYVFINIPSINPLMWHPFSLSSGPDERSGEVYVRGLGGFSKAVIRKAMTNSSVLIRVDGPYGNTNVHLTRYPVMIMIGGGIGLTPILGVLRDIYRTGDLSVEDVDRIPRHCISDIHVIWTIQSVEQYEWFQEDMEALQSASRHPYMPSLHITVHVTRPRAGQPIAAGFTTGRPNWKVIFDNIAASRPDVARSVFSCGPTMMIRDVWDETSRRSRKGESFDFHSETFSM